jgi:hypothetical protein
MEKKANTPTEPGLATVVPDSELREWLESGADEPRELIVEVRSPPRQISATPRAPGHGRLVNIAGSSAAGREDRLRQLAEFVTHFACGKLTLLKAAGALALRTSGKDARQIARHHLVKSIRPNRRLGQPG